jgi:hypothetical protein
MGTLKGSFFFIILNPRNLVELKNCIGGRFLEGFGGLYEFVKFTLCYYNILKIKNILIISI